MPNQEYRPVNIPDWLKQSESQTIPSIRGSEVFIDKTLRQIITLIKDTVFNEKTAKGKGLLQSINPLLKILTILSFIILISLQKSFLEIIPFLFLEIALILLSRLSPLFILKKILPITFLTLLITLPASLNLLIEGKELIVLFEFPSPLKIPGIDLPNRISITREGIISMLTLLMRVTCSVLFVFLLTMTTRPDRFIKSLMLITPKIFRPIIGITYRYIFFLIRRVEEFIMGLESRRITSIGSSKGRRWVASRIGLLFSITLELSRDLSLAMESRGYTDRSEPRKLEGIETFRVNDVVWLIFSLSFIGLMIWKSLM